MRKMNKGMAAIAAAAAIMTALPTGVLAATNSVQAAQKTQVGQLSAENDEMPQFDGREPRPVDENGKAINEDGSEVAEADLLPAPEGEMGGAPGQMTGQMPPQMSENGEMPQFDGREPRPVDENGKAVNEDGSEVAEADLLPAPEGEMGGAPGQMMGQMPPQMNENGEMPQFGQMPPQMSENGEIPQFDGREPRPVDENGKAVNEDGSEVAEADLGEAPEKPEGMQNRQR
ncbi:MAG: hypothetical protein K6E83_01670 [Clostridium sp.]|nr:hypothetical protein [Clostridium sp.]